MSETASAPVTLRIEKLVAGGDALAREDSGRVVFVPGGLPGETVRVRLTSAKKDLARGELLEVVAPSVQRVEPPCPRVADGCGGCDWQHLSVEGQAEARRAIVVESLTRIGKVIDPQVGAVEGLPSQGARTTIRVAIDASGRPGFRGTRSHDVVPTDRCLVAHPLVDEVLQGLRATPGTELTIRVGAATGERGVWWEPADAPAPTGLPSDVRLGADAVVHEVVDGRRLRVSPGSFFQASREAAESVVAAVRRAAAADLEALADGATVVDAYGGVGLFGATVVPERLRLVSVEGSRSSCADAETNLAGRDARVVRCSVERWRPEPAGLVIADPSRSGLGAGAVERLAATGAPTLVLVSCDPVALARDTALLRTTGYDLGSCESLDLFPHTHHVETVSVFRRRDQRGTSSR